MAEYVALPVETSPDALATAALTYIADRVPGWAPAAGNLETILVEALASMVAEARTVASDVPPAIFRYFGKLVGVLPIESARASVGSTWTMVDNAGYTVRAGTYVGIRTAGDTLAAFRVEADVVVPPGSTTTAAGAVTLVAVEAGAAGSGLAGPGELQDALDYVAGIALVGTTAGGRDAESDDAYLDRLSDELRLMAPRPILAADFAVLARRTPGVARALALDGYNPSNSTYTNERMIAVAVIDAAGLALSAGVKAAVDADLQSRREVNFIVNVIDPTYTAVWVSFTATAHAGSSTTAVRDAGVAALQAALGPARWGLPDYGDRPLWLAETIVRRFELAAILDRVEGLHHVLTLTLKAGSAPAVGDTADITLAGAAPLPTPGTITGTVT